MQHFLTSVDAFVYREFSNSLACFLPSHFLGFIQHSEPRFSGLFVTRALNYSVKSRLRGSYFACFQMGFLLFGEIGEDGATRRFCTSPESHQKASASASVYKNINQTHFLAACKKG